MFPLMIVPTSRTSEKPAFYRESIEAVNVDLPDSAATDQYWPSVATEPSRPGTADTETRHSRPITRLLIQQILTPQKEYRLLPVDNPSGNTALGNTTLLNVTPLSLIRNRKLLSSKFCFVIKWGRRL